MSVSAASDAAPGILFPTTMAEAVALLDAHAGAARILAGGTWLMRAPVRGQALPRVLVSLARVDGVRDVAQRGGGWTIGPCATHAGLAQHFGASRAFRALGQAAAGSANPGVRRLATIGGNIATADFAAADLLPALLALDASVTLLGPSGPEDVAIEAFLARRPLRPNEIIAGIDLPESRGFSGHARLTQRRAGEYPVAIVSVAATHSAGDRIEAVRIAVGSVEATARRWPALEAALAGGPLDAAAAEAAARESLAGFSPRGGADAPGWYRTEVLPHLVRTAFADIERQTKG